MPAPAVNARTVGGGFESDPLLKTWVDIITVPDASVTVSGDGTIIGLNYLNESFEARSEIPATGDMHPIYRDTCCARSSVKPLSGSIESPVGIRAEVTWITPHIYADGTTAKAIYTSNYLTQEIRNFDVEGLRTRVFYTIANPNPMFPPYRIADIRVPRTMHAMKIVQYENLNNAKVGDLTDVNNSLPSNESAIAMPFFNSDTWLDFRPNTLAFVGRNVQCEGLPICRVEYNFLVNDRGWNKFISVYTQQNGYVPNDLEDLDTNVLNPAFDADEITAKNGIGVFDMLDRVSFGDEFPQISDSRIR